ncbi:hypothetical protein D3C80_1135880 [compost metagenome]
MVRRHIAGLEVDAADAVVVAADEAPQDLGQVAALGRTQPPDDAEVDGRQLRRGVGEQIALVQVGVEDAVIQRLDQEGAHHLVGQGVLVQARQVAQSRVRHRQAGGPFQRQHPLAHPVPDDGGGGHIAVLGHDLGQFGGGGRLQPHVQFKLQRLGDDLDEGARLQPTGGLDEAVDQGGPQAHGVQPLGHAPLDAGTQHLDRHLAPVGQPGRVRLGQGGGAHGLGQVDEQALGRTAQRALDLALGLLQREGRQLVLQSPQVLGELQAEDVGAGGQHLAQLDGDGAEVLEGLADALARPSGAMPAAGEQLDQAGEGAAPGGQQGVGLARDQGVVARQHPPPADQAESRAHRMAHGPGLRLGRRGVEDQPAQVAHPWWMAAMPPDRLVTLTRLKPASSIIRLKVG